MTTDIKALKKMVAKDWANAFPTLTQYGTNKFYKIVGPMITGIELIRLSFGIEEYRAYTIMYGLWNPDLKTCLKGPELFHEVEDKKGSQLDIPYKKHQDYFEEAIQCAQAQACVPFHQATPQKILANIDGLFNHFLFNYHAGKQAHLYKLKCYIALYINDQAQIQVIVDQIEQARKNWNMESIELYYDISYDVWFQQLQDKINDRAAFMEQIAKNSADKKLQKLQRSELVM